MAKDNKKGGVNDKNKGMKMLLLIVNIIFIALIVFSISSTVTLFTDRQSNENITLNASVNRTLYIDIPKNAYVTNFTLTFEGESVES